MKCLRCGTALQNHEAFCSDCSKVTSLPLESSPYMSNKIVLPKRQPSQNTKKQEFKKDKKIKKGHSVLWIFCSFLLLVICGVLLFQGVCHYEKYLYAQTELERLTSVEDECVRLTDKLRQAQESVATLEQELSQLGPVSYLETREELKLTQSENTLLKEELQKSQEQVASLEAQLITLLEKAEFFDTHIVFVQEDGTNSFHRYDCDKFARNGYRAYNKEQALSLGYIPCEYCK